METGASLRALKPTSLRTGGLSHTPLRERCFFRGGAPEKSAEFCRIPRDLDKMLICFAAEAAKFCEAGLAAGGGIGRGWGIGVGAGLAAGGGIGGGRGRWR